MALNYPDPLDLHYTESGNPENPALVILHGLFGSIANWRSISKKFADHFYVITVDMRNHGDSPWHDVMDYTSMAVDVAWLIEQKGLVNPSVLGHSMGGKAAMTMAQLKLTGIANLIVADIAPVTYNHTHQEFIDVMNSADFSLIKSRSDVDKVLALHISSAPIRQFLLQNLVREESGYRWRINLEAIELNMPSLLGFETTNTTELRSLFIGGANSTYITPRTETAITRFFPFAEIQTIDNAGHWLHAEQPEKFIDVVETFLLR